MSISALFIVFLVTILGCLYGTSAGGAAFLMFPLLIFLGIPSHEVVATFAFGFISMNIVGALTFHKAGALDISLGVRLAMITIVGTCIGILLFQSIEPNILTTLLGASIFLLAVLLLINPELGVISRQTSPRHRQVGWMSCIFLGLYMAIVLTGGSVVASYILMMFFGQTYLESAATRKIVFLPNNFILATVYALEGLVHWKIGFVIFIAAGIGSYAGAHLALRQGNRWVRTTFLTVAIIISLKMLI